MRRKAVIMLDGGYVKKYLEDRLGKFPEPGDILSICAKDIMEHDRLKEAELLRIYYYDAPPFEGTSKNPLSGEAIDFGAAPNMGQNKSLMSALEFEPDVAIRRGKLKHNGWKLGKRALQNLAKKKDGKVCPKDLVPNFTQKGVDLRIGLDIAWISIKRIADILVLVSGDSDFVPAIKFARREGMRVYLLGPAKGISMELRQHADLVLEPKTPRDPARTQRKTKQPDGSGRNEKP